MTEQKQSIQPIVYTYTHACTYIYSRTHNLRHVRNESHPSDQTKGLDKSMLIFQYIRGLALCVSYTKCLCTDFASSMARSLQRSLFLAILILLRAVKIPYTIKQYNLKYHTTSLSLSSLSPHSNASEVQISLGCQTTLPTDLQSSISVLEHRGISVFTLQQLYSIQIHYYMFGSVFAIFNVETAFLHPWTYSTALKRSPSYIYIQSVWFMQEYRSSVDSRVFKWKLQLNLTRSPLFDQ